MEKKAARSLKRKFSDIESLRQTRGLNNGLWQMAIKMVDGNYLVYKNPTDKPGMLELIAKVAAQLAKNRYKNKWRQIVKISATGEKVVFKKNSPDSMVAEVFADSPD